MSASDIVKRHPAIFGKPNTGKYGKCHCGLNLVREWSGPDTYYICCPESHSTPRHVCYLDEDPVI